jgi:hypothetical protein
MFYVSLAVAVVDQCPMELPLNDQAVAVLVVT